MMMEASTLQLLTAFGGTALGSILTLSTTWFLNNQHNKAKKRSSLLSAYCRWAASVEAVLAANRDFIKKLHFMLAKADKSDEVGIIPPADVHSQMLDCLTPEYNSLDLAKMRLQQHRYNVLALEVIPHKRDFIDAITEEVYFFVTIDKLKDVTHLTTKIRENLTSFFQDLAQQ